MQKYIKVISINIFDNGNSKTEKVNKIIKLKDFKGYEKSDKKKHKNKIFITYKNLFK